jgi:hypothetical protein
MSAIEIHFWKSFWDTRYSFLTTLLSEKWVSRSWEQSMTTNLIDVYLTE